MKRMTNKYLIVLSVLLIISCRKKHLPVVDNNTNKSEVTVVKKAPVKKGPWPKTLSVDDRIASKTVDGRLYFDLDGKRYWKNYTDGKYYLFNKSMYDNPGFKPH